MDPCLIDRIPPFLDLLDPAVAVDHADIGIAEVRIVPVQKDIVLSRHRKGLDPVALHQVFLHAVGGDKKMPSPLHDGMAGIIEEVLHIKLELRIRIQEIGKVGLVEQDRIMDIDAGFAEIHQGDDLIRKPEYWCPLWDGDKLLNMREVFE